jgi:hypothetical protein
MLQDVTEGRTEELNLKHNLCYWMSNKPGIKDDYFYTKYNELPNLRIIKESQLQISV